MDLLLTHTRTAPRHRLTWLAAVFVYVSVTSLLSLELTRIDSRFSALWLANAGVLAAMLVSPRSQHGELMLAAFAAMLLTKGVPGHDWRLAVVFAGANGVEIFLACRLIEQSPDRRVNLTGLRGLVQFLIICMGPAPMLSATLEAAYVTRLGGGFLREAVDWHLSHALGMIVAVPPMLVSYSRLFLRKGPGRLRVGEPLFYSVAVLALTSIIFSQPLALIYLILPLVCLTSFRCGFLGAGMSAVVVAFAATALTVSGHGPIAATTSDPVTRIYLLQGFIACCVLTGLPIAVVLNERNGLNLSLSASERRFRHLSQAAPIGIMTIAPDRHITYANRELAQIAGRSVNQLLAERVGQSLDDTLRDQIDQALEASERSRTYADVAFGITRDGQDRWFQTRFAAIDDEDRQPVGWIGTVMDVTQLRHSEQRLAQSERELRLLADNVGDLICRLDEDGRVLYASAATGRLFDISPREVEGQSLLGFVEQQDREPVRQALADLALGARNQIRSFRWITPTGERRWVEASFRSFSGTAAQGRLVATIRDISERKAAEAAILVKNTQLQEANRLLRLAEDVARIGHWHYDLASGKADWSPLFAAIHGLPADQPARAGDYIALLGAAQFAQMRACAKQAIAQGQRFRLAIHVTPPDGKPRTIEMQGQGEVDGAGELRGLFGVCQDITAQLEIQETLRQARDRALSAAQARARFLAVMSHEIRTPMTGVLATFELLSRHSAAIAWPLPDIPRLITATQAHARTLMTVLDDVLDQAKLEAGRMELECAAFDAGEVLAGAVDVFQSRARERGITLTLASPGPVPVTGDASRLNQVITNLLSNAIKFTPEGSITARIEKAAPASYRISITDTGIGIPPAAMERILEPFSQLDSSTSRQFGGTGLGLAIVNNLVSAMGGTLVVTANPGGGSVFAVTLPLAAPQAAPPSPPLPSPSLPSPALPCAEATPAIAPGLRVLIVDDTEATRLAAQVHLQALGCQATGVPGGAEAIQAVMAGDFDAAMIDSAMPGLDGAATIRLLRHLPGRKGRLPILGFTAYSQQSRHRDLIEAGASHVIAKPFTAAMLQRGLDAVLKARADQRGEEANPLAGFMAAFPPAAHGEMLAQLAIDLEGLGAVLRSPASGEAERDRAVHMLKGISGTYGLDVLEGTCGLFEQSREAMEPVPQPCLDVLVASIDDALGQIHQFAA
jgi:PAS domain S-box-containing protein